MNIIRPIAITDAMMVSSNITETDETEWADDVTYGVGDVRMVLTRSTTNTVGSNYLASHRGNFIDGHAFFEIQGADLSDFVGTDAGSAPWKIEVTDSAGKKAVGYIGAGGTGRLYGTNRVPYEITASKGWTLGAGWSSEGNDAVSANGLLCSHNAGLVANQLYSSSFRIEEYTSGDCAAYYGDAANHFYHRTSAVTFTEYGMTDGAATFGFNGFGASALKISGNKNLFCKAITEPVVAASGGVHIVASPTSTYRGWASIEAGFLPYEIATYEITQEGVAYHKIYESLLGSNLNKFPPINLTGATPYWLEIGSTNRWKVFDSKTYSQTSNASTIEYELLPGAFDSIAFFNLDADSITLTLTDPIEGVVYSSTVDLILTGNVLYAYTAAKLNIPSHPAATLDIVITKAGGTAKCGEIVLGLQYALGITTPNLNIGITDYSTKETDDFGNFIVTERAYALRNSFDLVFYNTLVDEIFEMVAAYRATPVVWIDSNNSDILIYGFYKDFSVAISGPVISTCTVEVEGLT